MKIILVSHSEQLGLSTKKYLLEMIPDLDKSIIELACGTFDSRIGTDFQKIIDIVEKNKKCNDFILICDLGSAILSAQAAQALTTKRLHISTGSFIEGAFACAIAIKSNASFEFAVQAAEEQISKI